VLWYGIQKGWRRGVALVVVHSLSCSSTNRAQRTPGSVPQRLCMRAQVESCGRELSALSTYHQRCRICEVHLKLTSFEHRGKPQRFCQQCGRCHELACFEGIRRSCRNQLAKHNARCAASHAKHSCVCTVLRCVHSVHSVASVATCMLVGGKPGAQIAAWWVVETVPSRTGCACTCCCSFSLETAVVAVHEMSGSIVWMAGLRAVPAAGADASTRPRPLRSATRRRRALRASRAASHARAPAPPGIWGRRRASLGPAPSSASSLRRCMRGLPLRRALHQRAAPAPAPSPAAPPPAAGWPAAAAAWRAA